MSRTRIKFCGLARMEDIEAAVALGVDAIGFVFTRRSRRFIEPGPARVLRERLPANIQAVALLMDDEAAWVQHVIDTVHPDLLQFHGSEPVAFAARFGLPYLKAVPMASGGDPRAVAAEHPDAAGFLLDSHAAGAAGGTGEAFDWSQVPRGLSRPLWLAGGLHPGNVAAAIAAVRPFAVDVSSGIERAPGVKDPDRMAAFVLAAGGAARLEGQC